MILKGGQFEKELLVDFLGCVNMFMFKIMQYINIIQ